MELKKFYEYLKKDCKHIVIKPKTMFMFIKYGRYKDNIIITNERVSKLEKRINSAELVISFNNKQEALTNFDCGVLWFAYVKKSCDYKFYEYHKINDKYFISDKLIENIKSIKTIKNYMKIKSESE